MATNFLEALGTNGFIATPFNLLTTELNSLANGSSATSSVGGTSGVFDQTSNASAIWGIPYLTATTTFTPTAGAYIAGWFLFSPDGGSTFETPIANADMPRPPNFVIPLDSAALGASSMKQASGIVQLPWWDYKVFVVNHAGVALPATGNVIKLGPVAIQY
jgi:hypothetical protein